MIHWNWNKSLASSVLLVIIVWDRLLGILFPKVASILFKRSKSWFLANRPSGFFYRFSLSQLFGKVKNLFCKMSMFVFCFGNDYVSMKTIFLVPKIIFFIIY